MGDKPITLRDVERRTNQLIDTYAEMDRLDEAAGDPIVPRLTIKEWVSLRLREAAQFALSMKGDDNAE